MYYGVFSRSFSGVILFQVAKLNITRRCTNSGPINPQIREVSRFMIPFSQTTIIHPNLFQINSSSSIYFTKQNKTKRGAPRRGAAGGRGGGAGGGRAGRGR